MGQESQKAEGTSTQQSKEEAAKREAWRKVITRVRFPKPGCFNASYPSTEWKEVPCSTKPPPLQLPPPEQGAGRVILENVGNGDSNDWAAGVSGSISTAEGEIISVSNGTTETDSLTTESDQFSLQLNSQHFTTPLCNGGNAGCYGWQQFVFSNQGGMGLSSQAVAFIQYWLINWGTTPCPGEAWQQQGSDCIINVANNPTTWGALSASSLAGTTVTAHAGQSASDLDNVMVVAASGSAQATATANYLNLAQYWNAAEFNVFGYGNGSTANFSNGTTIVVKTGVNSGVTNPPLCVPKSFTGGQNSLNLANITGTSTLVCCPYRGGSPNIQFIETNALHETGTCGSTQIVGDTHITTANSVRYDFQSAGEFVSLRDSSGDEIQTRQAPVSTTFIGTDAYDGLTTCVSLNTAVAVRVGEHRVTYQPNLSGVPDPRGLQLRIDGVPTALGLYGRDLGNGGRVFKSATGADLEIDFPDGKTLFVTPEWWASQSKWYLNVVVAHLGLVSSPGGIAGPIANGSWLPALPSGASLGPMPGPLADRYATLYTKFADAPKPLMAILYFSGRLDKVTVHNHLLGGGFGRRLEADMVDSAVRIAKHVDAPIKVVWTREEDIQHDIYRPVYRDVISATLSGGKIAAWKYRVTGSSIMARWFPAGFQNGIDIDAVDSAIDIPYDIPNLQVEYVRAEPPAVPTGFWRGVGPNNNVFAIECFIDELARKAGADPIAFRRGMLGKTPRLQAALDLVAEKSGWGESLPARAGRGVSVQPSFASFIATVVEAQVDDRGEVQLRKVTSSRRHRDCGQSRHYRRAAPGWADLWPDGGALWRDHHRQGPRAAIQFQRLPHAADRRGAADGGARRQKRRGSRRYR
jgi:hypothetical protein